MGGISASSVANENITIILSHYLQQHVLFELSMEKGSPFCDRNNIE